MKKLAYCLLVTAIACSAANLNISDDLAALLGSQSTQQVQVIVQWKSSANSGLLSTILALGGTVISELTAVHAGIYLLPASALSALSLNPNVAFISPDRPVYQQALLSRSVAAPAATISAPYAWNLGYTGLGSE